MFVPGMYAFVDAWQKAAAPWQSFYEQAAAITDAQANNLKGTPFAAGFRSLTTFYDVMARGLHDYPRRPFDIKDVETKGSRVPVAETVINDKAFMRSIQFSLTDDHGKPLKRNVPQILLVAPMSGHFSTLLRKTVIGLLPYADVRITDWKNAKNIPVSEGKFGIEDFEQYVHDEMEDIGPNTHVMAVCQPTVLTMAAVARMSKEGNKNRPLSMTLLGGPIDPSANPTQPVQLAAENGIGFFKTLIDYVPFGNNGVGRKVYPGFKQLLAFVSMNTARHADSGKQYVVDLQQEDFKSAKFFRQFYDEFLAVMDMTAEFFLETIDEVFIKQSLAKGTLELHGETVDLAAIKDVTIMTVEGEEDDISAPGQDCAAHDLCPNVPNDMKFAHLEPEAGHYGIFSGRRFRENIAPKIIAMTHTAAARKGIQYDPVDLDLPQTWCEAKETVYADYGLKQETPKPLSTPSLKAA